MSHSTSGCGEKCQNQAADAVTPFQEGRVVMFKMRDLVVRRNKKGLKTKSRDQGASPTCPKSSFASVLKVTFIDW